MEHWLWRRKPCEGFSPSPDWVAVCRLTKSPRHQQQCRVSLPVCLSVEVSRLVRIDFLWPVGPA